MDNKFRMSEVSFSWFFLFTFFALSMFSQESAAATSQNLATIATTITSSFGALTKLIIAGAYLAGIGFSIGAIMKFKQHKDNPTQVTIGTPIALLFIGAALLFLPSILGVAGATIFGSGATTAGPGGTIFTQSGS